ncbi:hypothetical protein [Chamaesiphon sp. VAR_48_metabat_403]|uniref:hypothetical protein n=1 Tax=Chamaesiphon sp. VAR_48_metabat_403 TaxID=2964700 RepID=UPI00286DEBD9|nr:hypothetical protein [Chamaesiphon sp. VAR_48_metabat_403]
MIGSTILTTQNPSSLLEIENIDDLGRFTCIELDRMATLDLEIFANLGGVKWAESQPSVYRPDEGLAIFKIATSGLIYLQQYSIEAHSEHCEDLSKLVEFVKRHGIDRIYELATF